MGRALESLGTDSAYLEFFGLTRPPFARLSSPSQIFDTEQYSLLTDHLANATAHPDRLLVICGADGSGKTTLLNRYIASLGDDVYFATIDETITGATNFHCTFLRQLGFGDISGTLSELRTITEKFLIHRGMAGDSVLLIIDNANLIHLSVLEQLRWLAAIKVDERRVFSVALAGNSDLLHIMESPAMSGTKFGGQVQFHIRAYSEEEIAGYIWHRLNLADGGNSVKFSSTAHALIYRFTGGVPNLINMLCEALLKQAHAVKSRVITDELVRAVADKQRLLPHLIPLHGKGRRKTDPDFKLVPSVLDAVEGATDGVEVKETALPTPGAGNSHVEELLSKVSLLSVELGALRADRKRNLRDIGTRDADIDRLRKEVHAQTAEIEVLSGDIDHNMSEIDEARKALATSVKALRKNEKTTTKLRTSLAKERKLAKHANAELARFSGLESELKNAKRSLAEAHVQITEDSKTITHLKADLFCSPTPKKKARARKQKSKAGTATTAAGKAIIALELIREGGIEKVFEVSGFKPRMMIGRNEDNDVCLNSMFVSGHHALLIYSRKRITVEDLNSANGTFVNSKPITRRELRVGDTVNIGDFELIAK